MLEEEILLTKFSKGAGCGCKISPAVLDKILSTGFVFGDKNLLVGNSTKDDAAVYDIGNGTALISTADFFMPIVDDAYDFGRIAAANAISDIYAMGGNPILAVAILGWPVGTLPESVAAKVLDGARTVCSLAGISVAGGHSIESAEPFFGLSVNGMVQIANLKRNDGAKEGDLLLLTKPLGTGVLSTAQKRKVLQKEHLEALLDNMTKLNSVGATLARVDGVHAMTDVTGFGLAGHLLEMANGSNLSAKIEYKKLQLLPGVAEYLRQRVIPDATFRNWQSYQQEIEFADGVDVMQAFSLLPDPQTNGGLLISVAPEALEDIRAILASFHLNDFLEPIGEMVAKDSKAIYVVDQL